MDSTDPVLPPSPPISNPSCATSHTICSNSPVWTPPKTPDTPPTQGGRNQTPPPGESPLPPLPAEVFFLALSHLSSHERRPLQLVSKKWREFVAKMPATVPPAVVLLDRDDDATFERVLDLVNVNGEKARTGVRDLVINLPTTNSNRRIGIDLVDHETAMNRLNLALTQVDGASAHYSYDRQGRPISQPMSTLRSLTVLLRPISEVSVSLFAHFAAMAQIPLFKSLAQLIVHLGPSGFKIDGNFFGIWPDLVTLKIVAAADDFDRSGTLAQLWTIPTSRNRPGPCRRLENLEFHNIYIFSKLSYVFMPSLTRLVLHKCTWAGKGLFFLLRIVRHSLVHLECVDLAIEELDDVQEMEDDWYATVLTQYAELLDGHQYQPPEDVEGRYEEPAPIIFNALRTLILIGEATPPIFSTLEYNDFSGSGDPSGYATPTFVMPNLTKLVLEELVTDQEGVEDNEGDGVLAVLGRNAPRIAELELYKIVATPASIFHCLAGMGGKITKLSLQGSEATDKLIARLPGLLPLLESLDVRECPEVSVQGLARLVQVIRQEVYEGNGKISKVWVDHPAWIPAEIAAYEWLDYISVLERDETDPEGLGPKDPESRKQWIREGKKDVQAVERQKRQQETDDAARAQLTNELAVAQRYGFQSGSANHPLPPPHFTPMTTTPYPLYVQAQQQQQQQPRQGVSPTAVPVLWHPPPMTPAQYLQHERQYQYPPHLPPLPVSSVDQSQPRRAPDAPPYPTSTQQRIYTPPTMPANGPNTPRSASAPPPPSYPPNPNNSNRGPPIDPRLAFVGTLRTSVKPPESETWRFVDDEYDEEEAEEGEVNEMART